jgi:amino acid adenylation domain-containing protein
MSLDLADQSARVVRDPREHLLALCRGPAKALPASSVYALFRAQAARSPSRPALSFGDQTLSYRELEQRVEALSLSLFAAGAEPGALLGLCVVRGLDMVVAMLAILRTGAAYVPIDPEAPHGRIDAILRESRPRFVLASASVCARFETGSCPVSCLDELLVRSAPQPGFERAPLVESELAYVIFTSGSTGTPKGVEVRHAALANHALSMAELYALGPTDRVLCSASIGFDVAGEQIYPALASGACVVVRPETLFQSLTSFDSYLHAAEISVLILPTAFFHEWTRTLSGAKLSVPPAVRVVGVGTEQVAASELDAFLRAAQGRVRFLQGYGPTEATVTCTAYVHDGRPLSSSCAVPIGLPLPNTEAYVFDETLALTADDEVGELYVGGAQLARGYLGRPELTRERFVANPFAPGREARLYRTGDLVRRAADGQLTFVGREDDQIKVRGHRVEPREIELVLCEQPDVSEALVLLRKDAAGAAQLVAYLVAPTPLDPAQLVQACRAHLPAYMVPSAFVTLPTFPKTLNQKIDRAALPAPVEPKGAARVAARNDAELLVTHAFEEALGLGHVGIHDDFFQLGGDSLRALRMLQLIRRSASRELALADLFAAPTVADLAARIREGGGLDHPSVLCLKQGRGTPLFLVCGIQIYQALADALAAPNPVYALLLPIEGAIANGTSRLPPVEELAREYVQTLREHTPQGPYALGGVSFGGVVAYEMAQQLTRAGEQVSVLALFDTVLPRAKRRLSRAVVAHQLSRVRAHGPRALGTTLAGLARQLRARVRRKLLGRRPRTGAELGPKAVPTATDAALLALDRQREEAYGLCFVAYDKTIRPYAGPAVLYRARSSEEGARLPCYGFARLLPQVTLQDVSGDHLGLLRAPDVAELASHFGAVLHAD